MVFGIRFILYTSFLSNKHLFVMILFYNKQRVCQANNYIEFRVSARHDNRIKKEVLFMTYNDKGNNPMEQIDIVFEQKNQEKVEK